MNLVWHIVGKDLRRFAAPVAVWVALIGAPLVAFRFFSPEVEGHMASSLEASVRVMGIWLRILVGGQLVIGFALAGALVLDDPWRGTTAFWKTRPIAKRRLLAAKLLGAVVAFIVVPLAALAVVWFASGFSGREAGAAAWAFVKPQGGVVLLAFVLAVLSRHLAQLFLFTFVVVAVGVVSMPVLKPVVWRMQAEARQRDVVRFEERPEDRAAEIIAGPTFTTYGGNSVPFVYVTAPWTRDRGYVPALVHWGNGLGSWGAEGAGASQAGLRALGFNKETGPLRWHINVYPSRRSATVEEELHATGSLEVWAGRMRIVGEMPIRVGEGVAEGAARTRILGLERVQGWLNAIYIEERDAAATAAGAWDREQWTRAAGDVRFIDHYYLINRSTGEAVALRASPGGELGLNSMVARYRRLSVPSTKVWSEGVLVKLRFEIERRFERPLDVRGVTTLGKERAR